MKKVAVVMKSKASLRVRTGVRGGHKPIVVTQELDTSTPSS